MEQQIMFKHRMQKKCVLPLLGILANTVVFFRLLEVEMLVASESMKHRSISMTEVKITGAGKLHRDLAMMMTRHSSHRGAAAVRHQKARIEWHLYLPTNVHGVHMMQIVWRFQRNSKYPSRAEHPTKKKWQCFGAAVRCVT